MFDVNKHIEAYENGEDLGGSDEGFEWMDIYGAHKDVTGKHSTIMRENPEYASQWMGRILTQVTVYSTENPIIET